MTLWKIFAVDTQFKQLRKRSLKKNSGFSGIRTRDLCDTGAVLYQLSSEAITVGSRSILVGLTFTAQHVRHFSRRPSCIFLKFVTIWRCTIFPSLIKYQNWYIKQLIAKPTFQFDRNLQMPQILFNYLVGKSPLHNITELYTSSKQSLRNFHWHCRWNAARSLWSL